MHSAMRSSSARLAITIYQLLTCMCCLNTAIMAAIVPVKTIQISHYSHEIRGGPNNALLVAAGTLQPNLGVGVAFGSFVVFDNVMKAGESPDSQMLGRVVGTVVGVVKPSSTPNNTTRVQLVMQHIYMEGSPYSGSMVNVVGSFFFPPPWEMSILGATGKLRGYTGYGICQPVSQTMGEPPLFLVYRWDFYLTKTDDGFEMCHYGSGQRF